MYHYSTSRHITSRHVISRHNTSRHITSRHITSRHITSRQADVPSHTVPSQHITSHHITSPPGGWSVCLVSSGCQQVTAVDPGLLTLPPAVLASGRVEHLRMRFEEALPLMQARGDGSAVEMLVCDINDRPSVVIGMVRQALPLLRAHCALVLTFKNSYDRKAEWHAAMEAALDELRALAVEVVVLHLLANTSKETTVVAKLRENLSIEDPPTA